MQKRVIILLLTFISTGLNIFAQMPTRWRGPNGNGIYDEVGLLNEWPDSGPEIIWYFEGLGEGHSSPAFANNMIYLSGMVDGEGYIYALSQEGK